MKICILILLLAISLIAAGCGSAEPAAPTSPPAAETTVPATEPAEVFDAEAYLASVKAESDAIRTMLAQVEMTQLDMNTKAEELKHLWQEALTRVWGELRRNLPEAEFEELLKQQVLWNEQTRAAVEAAGKEVEGGSLFRFAVNNTEARLLEARVYELAELLK